MFNRRRPTGDMFRDGFYLDNFVMTGIRGGIMQILGYALLAIVKQTAYMVEMKWTCVFLVTTMGLKQKKET